MKKLFKRCCLSLLLFVNLFVLVSCNKTYTITLNLYDDERYIIESKKVKDYDLPELSNRRQYFFKGWYDNEEFEGEPITSLDVKKDINLYAKWEYISKYKIIYCNNLNGVYEESESYEYLYGYSELYFLEKPFSYKSREIKGYSFTNGGALQVTDTIGDEEVLHYSDQNGVVKLYTVWGGPYEISYDFGEGVFEDKYALRDAYFTDFYNFILSKEDGKNHLESNGVYSLEDFLAVASGDMILGGSTSIMYSIGNLASNYYLNIEIGGTLENQPDTHFIGWCYKNNKWVDFIEFLMVFFAYWRTDEHYTGGRDDPNNLGNDFFASAWASLVDTGKLFYFTKDTCPSFCATERVVNCLENVPGCIKKVELDKVIDDTNLTLPSISMEGRTFLGWYDNDECVGQEITILKVSQVKSEITLYAKWKKNE